MCIAIPGKLIAVDGQRGQADVRGNILSVELGLVPQARLGDSLLIHAGCAIAIVSETEADELNELFTMVENYEQNT